MLTGTKRTSRDLLVRYYKIYHLYIFYIKYILYYRSVISNPTPHIFNPTWIILSYHSNLNPRQPVPSHNMSTRAKRASRAEASKAANAAKVVKADVTVEEGGGEAVEQANGDDSTQPTNEIIRPSTVSDGKGYS